MRRALLNFLAIAGLAILTGCGFQLRGQSPLPFEGAYVEAASDSPLGTLLRNHLDRQSKLITLREKADVVLLLTAEKREKSILTLSGAGKVREYRLVHAVTVSAVGRDGQPLLAPAEIKQSRDVSYSDENVLAKEAEEASLRREMDHDILRQVLRRLAFVQTR
jgi:LPS-assembly lipoprotein